MALIPGLVRPTDDKIIAGVCSGIARYLKVDAGLVRIVTFLLIVPGGLSLWAYVIAWLVMPAEGAEKSDADRLLNEAKRFADQARDRRDATRPGSPTEVFDPYTEDRQQR